MGRLEIQKQHRRDMVKNTQGSLTHGISDK